MGAQAKETAAKYTLKKTHTALIKAFQNILN
jgi:hypothetical protein